MLGQKEVRFRRTATSIHSGPKPQSPVLLRPQRRHKGQPARLHRLPLAIKATVAEKESSLAAPQNATKCDADSLIQVLLQLVTCRPDLGTCSCEWYLTTITEVTFVGRLFWLSFPLVLRVSLKLVGFDMWHNNLLPKCTWAYGCTEIYLPQQQHKS